MFSKIQMAYIEATEETTHIVDTFISRKDGRRLINQEDLQYKALTSICDVFSNESNTAGFIDTEAKEAP